MITILIIYTWEEKNIYNVQGTNQSPSSPLGNRA